VEARPGHADLEPAKWVAVVSMTIDHAGKIVVPELYAETHLLGRLAMPLFAFIVGARLALSPGLASRYLRSLVPWAIASQPVYVVVGHDWSELNVLATLALGVVATWGVEALRAGRRGPGVWAIAGALLASPFVEFGPLGVALVPASAWLARHRVARAAWACGALGLVANLHGEPPLLRLGDVSAVLASAVAVASLHAPWRLPRLPKHLFYAWYPAHLYALHLLDLYG
jgi:hypothetical protein